jgi:hypothetical protein
MHDAIHEQQWEARMAYKQGWDVRMAYYDRILRGLMELIEGTVKIMMVDEILEVTDDLNKALLAIQNAWFTLVLEQSSSLVASGERTT